MRKLMIFVAASIVLISMAFSVSATPRIPMSIKGTTYGSLNWGGYAQTSSTYTSTSGTWTVPTLNNSVTGYSSVWVGIGGFSGNSVIQIGTEQDCLSGSATAGEMRFHGIDMKATPPTQTLANPGNSNHGGDHGGGKTTSSSCTPTYYSWWEMYPENAEQRISGMIISPGNTITASVNQNTNGTWTLTITDTTTGKSFSTTQTPNFTPDLGSAETIIERPELCTGNHCKLTDLADFKSISVGGSTMSNTADGIIMENNGGSPLISLGGLNNNGAFSVDWLASK